MKIFLLGHIVFYHQVEGLYIDKGVSFVDLKQTLLHFTKELFGKSKIRLRPSYFPFTEPSAELDIYWGLESEADYRITKGTGWLEILGFGMVDPNVLQNCKIDTEKFSGTKDNPHASKEEIDYLIRHVKKYFDIEKLEYI